MNHINLIKHEKYPIEIFKSIAIKVYQLYITELVKNC